MSDFDRLDALAAAYDAQVHRVRKSLEEFASALWSSQEDYRDKAVERMVAALVPRVQAGQVRTANLTRAYLVACAREIGLDTTGVSVVDVAEVTGQRGVDPEVVYRRPAVATYTALSEGKPYEDAVKAGGLRLLQLIGGDMQLAKRTQSRTTMRATGARFFRRILTGRENCALCMIAATQRYWVEDLMPIHPGCDCNSGPLPPDYPPDQQVIDDDELEAIHDAVANATGLSDRGARLPDYRDLIMETEHGEYGPLLSFKETKSQRKRRLKYQSKGFTLLPDDAPRPSSVPQEFMDKVCFGSQAGNRAVGGHLAGRAPKDKDGHSLFPAPWGAKEVAHAKDVLLHSPDIEYQRNDSSWRVAKAEVDGVICYLQYSYSAKRDRFTLHSLAPINGTVIDDNGVEHHVMFYDAKAGWITKPLDRRELDPRTMTP